MNKQVKIKLSVFTSIDEIRIIHIEALGNIIQLLNDNQYNLIHDAFTKVVTDKENAALHNENANLLSEWCSYFTNLSKAQFYRLSQEEMNYVSYHIFNIAKQIDEEIQKGNNHNKELIVKNNKKITTGRFYMLGDCSNYPSLLYSNCLNICTAITQHKLSFIVGLRYLSDLLSYLAIPKESTIIGLKSFLGGNKSKSPFDYIFDKNEKNNQVFNLLKFNKRKEYFRQYVGAKEAIRCYSFFFTMPSIKKAMRDYLQNGQRIEKQVNTTNN